MLCGESFSALESGLRWHPPSILTPCIKIPGHKLGLSRPLLPEFCEKFSWHPGSYFDMKSLNDSKRIVVRLVCISFLGLFGVNIPQKEKLR
jgi:hypothetical protein